MQQKTAVEWLAEEYAKYIETPWVYVPLGGKDYIINKAKQMENEQADKRVKDLESRLFNCSKDNADLMAKIQNK